MEMAVSMIRLDKYLADMSVGSRSEMKKDIRKGLVKVDEEVVRSIDFKINPEKSSVTYAGELIAYAEYEYYMLNKPAGAISASSDKKSVTVIDLIDTKLRKDLFPVGRLDKDTEGLLLITNDGALAHNLLAPKKHVDKVYYAKVAGMVNEVDQKAFAEGVNIGEEKNTLPADLKILKSGDVSQIELTIHEGKFHQVKRMFEALGKEVTYLKRLSMGSLVLDENLAPGEYRSLTEEELKQLCLNK